MKNSSRLKGIIKCVIPLLFLVTACEKNNQIDYKEFLGTWISSDFTDTIEFTTDKDFYKMFSGVKDHFDYSLTNDSIKIGYSGMMFILVKPTTHSYSLSGKNLTIDFRPECYGFRSQKLTFQKKELK
jgi:hypothetical protein